MATSVSWETAGGFPTTGVADIADFGTCVENRLRELLRRDRDRFAAAAPQSADIVDALSAAVLNGGKRLRPTLVLLGFLGAGGVAGDPRVVDVAAALELLHAGCLVHDDVMDDSPTRRHLPTTHTRFEAVHRAGGYAGETRRFAEGVATLVGDLAFFYCGGLLADSGTEVQRVFSAVAVDVGVGQYLDLLGTVGSRAVRPDPALIAHYKTGRYTVEGPLHLGAALAGRLTELAEVLSGYGRPLGMAYQLRDDLLGAFGDPEETGKPVGDDLRQGKSTLLLTYLRDRAPDSAARLLSKVERGELSDTDVPVLQRLLVELGARDYVEQTCCSLAAQAVEAIEHADLRSDVKATLTSFAGYVVGRSVTLPPQLR